MTRLRIFGIRLMPTALVVGIVLAFVYGLWYPGGYAELARIDGQAALLVVVSVVIGPGLTALVFRPGKRGLGVDLAIIAALELLAVGTMAAVLYQRQPAYTVFAVDRFEVVLRGEVDSQAFRDSALERRPAHSPRLVYATAPADPEAFDRLLEETLFMGLPDIDRRPEYWQPYPAGISHVRTAARPLGILAGEGQDQRIAVAKWLEAGDRRVDDYLFLPVRGRRSDAAMLVNALTTWPVAILGVNPWPGESASQYRPPASDVEKTHQ